MSCTGIYRGISAVAVMMLGLVAASASWAQDNDQPQRYGTQPGGYGSQQQPAGGAASQVPVINVHHHHYYSPQRGVYGPPLFMQRDPGDYADVVTGRPDASMDPQPWQRDWGGMGLFAYLGTQGGHSGLIVSRVTPNSPASKLGLVKGDYILQISGNVVADMSYRQLETLFSRMSTTPKVNVAIEVWNSHTQRMSTLKAELINDQAIKNEQGIDNEDDVP